MCKKYVFIENVFIENFTLKSEEQPNLEQFKQQNKVILDYIPVSKIDNKYPWIHTNIKKFLNK